MNIATLNEEILNILNEELYLYIQAPSRRKFRDWEELDKAFEENDFTEDQKAYWRKRMEILVGVSSNKSTLKKYLPATDENMKMLQAGKN